MNNLLNNHIPNISQDLLAIINYSIKGLFIVILLIIVIKSSRKCSNKILSSLSKLLMINKEKINLKGKTVEKLGIIGNEKAIACEVIVSVSNHD